MIVCCVTYYIKQGKREEFYQKVLDAGICEKSAAEGLWYEYFFPADGSDRILIYEGWKNQAQFDAHLASEHVRTLQDIKKDYLTDMKIDRYEIAR